MTAETIFSNARIVLDDEVLDGSLVVRDGRIVDMSSGNAASGEDFAGDYLIPGLIELHTDHLEAHYSPRPGVRWNTTAAIQLMEKAPRGASRPTAAGSPRGGFAPKADHEHKGG